MATPKTIYFFLYQTGVSIKTLNLIEEEGGEPEDRVRSFEHRR